MFSRFKDIIFIGIGIVSAVYGLQGFLLPNGIIDGGITGLSLLLSEVLSIKLSILLLVINLPFVYLGLRKVHIKYAIISFLSILGLIFFLHQVSFSVVTNDLLLASLFGGIFLGLGIGLAARGGGVLDGTEILAQVLKGHAGLSYGDIILLFNIILFGSAAIFIDIELVMYSILTYVAASKSVDFIIYGLEKRVGLIIVSKLHSELKQTLMHDFGIGVTILNGRTGFSDKQMDVIFCVVTRFELDSVHRASTSIDPNSFIVTYPVMDMVGGKLAGRSYL